MIISLFAAGTPMTLYGVRDIAGRFALTQINAPARSTPLRGAYPTACALLVQRVGGVAADGNCIVQMAASIVSFVKQ
jgi:hypothetical protein